jgi:hypothetical protein
MGRLCVIMPLVGSVLACFEYAFGLFAVQNHFSIRARFRCKAVLAGWFGTPGVLSKSRCAFALHMTGIFVVCSMFNFVPSICPRNHGLLPSFGFRDRVLAVARCF